MTFALLAPAALLPSLLLVAAVARGAQAPRQVRDAALAGCLAALVAGAAVWPLAAALGQGLAAPAARGLLEGCLGALGTVALQAATLAVCVRAAPRRRAAPFGVAVALPFATLDAARHALGGPLPLAAVAAPAALCVHLASGLWLGRRVAGRDGPLGWRWLGVAAPAALLQAACAAPALALRHLSAVDRPPFGALDAVVARWALPAVAGAGLVALVLALRGRRLLRDAPPAAPGAAWLGAAVAWPAGHLATACALALLVGAVGVPWAPATAGLGACGAAVAAVGGAICWRGLRRAHTAHRTW